MIFNFGLGGNRDLVYICSADPTCICFTLEISAMLRGTTENEPLNQRQIEELELYSSRYVIPHNQAKTKRYGLILYNSNHRHGANEEAGNFKHALQIAGCDVIMVQWSNTSELSSMIDRCLARIVDDCSLLIVAVMSHGYTGVLRGSAGSEIPINNILFKFQRLLPEHLPLVCQLLVYEIDFLSSCDVCLR